jgi:integrase
MGLSEAYRKQVVGVGKLFERWRGKTAPATFKRQDVEEFIEWARTPGNTKSAGRQIRNALAILRMVLRYSELAIPPAVNVAVPRRAPKTVTADQLKAFLAALSWGSVERAWAELDLRTGIRESEARGLTIGDVDLEAKVIRVRHGKGRAEERGSEELHPLPEGAVAALRAYREKQPRNLPDDAPFLAITSRRPRGRAGILKRRALEKGSLRKRLEAASEAAGLPSRGGVGWLRHQAATVARTSGQGLKKAAAALGHVDEKMVAATYDESTRAAEERWAARAELGARIDAALPVSPGFASGTKGPKRTGK